MKFYRNDNLGDGEITYGTLEEGFTVVATPENIYFYCVPGWRCSGEKNLANLQTVINCAKERHTQLKYGLPINFEDPACVAVCTIENV